MSTAELRQVFAASFSGRASTACPDPGDLWDAIELRLPPERRREIARHIAECSTCAESWRIALQMGATPSRWQRAVRDLADWYQPPGLSGWSEVAVAVGNGMLLGGLLSLYTGRPLAAFALCLAGLWVRGRGLTRKDQPWTTQRKDSRTSQKRPTAT